MNNSDLRKALRRGILPGDPRFEKVIRQAEHERRFPRLGENVLQYHVGARTHHTVIRGQALLKKFDEIHFRGPLRVKATSCEVYDRGTVPPILAFRAADGRLLVVLRVVRQGRGYTTLATV